MLLKQDWTADALRQVLRDKGVTEFVPHLLKQAGSEGKPMELVRLAYKDGGSTCALPALATAGTPDACA